MQALPSRARPPPCVVDVFGLGKHSGERSKVLRQALDARIRGLQVGDDISQNPAFAFLIRKGAH